MQDVFPLLRQVSANELTNGVVNAAFMLLFKDLVRLFACYNDGIINLLGNPDNSLTLCYSEFPISLYIYRMCNVKCIHDMYSNESRVFCDQGLLLKTAPI